MTSVMAVAINTEDLNKRGWPTAPGASPVKRRSRGLARPQRSAARAGMTLIEVVMVLGILAVAFGMFSTTMVASNRTRSINRDTALAAEAARKVFEAMRNLNQGQLYQLYNSMPADDPGGEGTAPGPEFAILGLDALPGDLDGMVGHITLAERLVDGNWQLREDVIDPALGLPRDLNGDSVLDELDHALDYLVFPVRIELDWQGRFGPRHMTVSTMLTRFRKGRR